MKKSWRKFFGPLKKQRDYSRKWNKPPRREGLNSAFERTTIPVKWLGRSERASQAKSNPSQIWQVQEMEQQAERLLTRATRDQGPWALSQSQATELSDTRCHLESAFEHPGPNLHHMFRYSRPGRHLVGQSAGTKTCESPCLARRSILLTPTTSNSRLWASTLKHPSYRTLKPHWLCASDVKKKKERPRLLGQVDVPPACHRRHCRVLLLQERHLPLRSILLWHRRLLRLAHQRHSNSNK